MKSSTFTIGAIVALSALQLCGGVCRWKGDASGNGSFSVDANWEGGAAPKSGDVIVIPESDAVRTIKNDLDETVEIDSVQILGVNRGKVNFTGTATLTLTGARSWTCTNAIDVSFPLELKPTANTSTLHVCCASGSSVDFRGSVELVGGWKSFVPYMPSVLAGVTDGSVHFYGTVTTPKNCDISPSITSSRVEMHFHGKVTTRAFKSDGYSQGKIFVYSSENDWDSADVSWGLYIMAGAQNVFTATAPLNFVKAGGASKANGYYHLQTFSQTANCLMSYGLGTAGNTPPGNVKSSGAVTLTLNGTQDAWTAAAICDAVSIVWDPSEDGLTQAFSNRASTTTGNLVVKRGRMLLGGTTTFASAGEVSVSTGATLDLDVTSSGVLAGCRLLSLDNGATLRIGASTGSPFGQTKAVVAEGAKVVFEDSQEIVFAQMAYADDTVTNATYTSDGRVGTAKADWIEGGGSVKVDSSVLSGYVWRDALNGNWEDGRNWACGTAPTAATADPVVIDAIGGDYTVTVADGTTLPKNLTVGQGIGTATVRILGGHETLSCPTWTVTRGGKVEVAQTGRLVCDFDAGDSGSKLAINDGGVFIVDGGEAVVTNMTRSGRLLVGGNGAAESLLAVKAGSLWISGYSTSGYVHLDAGGVLEAQGGVLYVASRTDLNPFMFNGGSIRGDGEGLVQLGGSHSSRLAFSRGTHVFAGNSVLGNIESRDDDYPQILPDNGQEARVRFTEHAKIANWGDNWIVGNVAGGKGYLEFESDQEHGWDASGGIRFIGKQVILGGVCGYGEMSVSNGRVGIGWGGLTVGGPTDVSKTSDIVFEGSEAVLKVSGGELKVHGYYTTGWATTVIGGLSIGYGGAVPTGEVPAGRPYRGRVEVTGGRLSSVRNHIVVGTGYGSGEVVQNGGVVYIPGYNGSSPNYLIVGFVGGEGVYAISNGVFETIYDAYVGGVVTNILGSQVACLGAKANLPAWRHDAVGTVSFAGGVFAVTNKAKTAKLVLGADGSGTLERIGSAGTLRVSNLILSNTVENASSGATLRFTLDPAKGCAPIEVENRLEVRGGAKVVVDTGDYEPSARRLPLLTANAIDGMIDPASVSIVGKNSEKFKFVQRAKNLELKRTDLGLSLVIR